MADFDTKRSADIAAETDTELNLEALDGVSGGISDKRRELLRYNIDIINQDLYDGKGYDPKLHENENTGGTP